MPFDHLLEPAVLALEPAMPAVARAVETYIDVAPATPATRKALRLMIGGLSKPSKMPGYAWGISAKICITGSKLRKVKGSTCSKCYALKGMYVFPNVARAHRVRLDAFNNLGPVIWSRAMARLIELTYARRKGADRVFRIFDSGDLQSLAMLHAWNMIAFMLPSIEFWMPTREVGMLNRYSKEIGTIAPNLVIRPSAPMIDMEPAKWWPTTSTVYSKGNAPAFGYLCPAYTQGGKCGECRACWNKGVDNVAYPQH